MAQQLGAVNKAETMLLHAGSEPKKAVTSTGKPSAGRLIKVTVCGLVPIGYGAPLTVSEPALGGLVKVMVTSAE